MNIKTKTLIVVSASTLSQFLRAAQLATEQGGP